MQRNQHGFTLVEITAVLVLMAIIAAYVIGRSIGTEQIELSGQTDKIRTQIRYVQAMALKRSEPDKIWGIKFDTGPDQYWLFSVDIPVDLLDVDQPINQFTFPGEQNKKVSAADFGVDILPPGFTLFFDRFGRPYDSFTDESNQHLLDTAKTITVSADTLTRTITVIPETGLVQ
jgi:prepilin-type N-terminal cleavage/methylation domain-containing protein